jgi:hypothetical protein
VYTLSRPERPASVLAQGNALGKMAKETCSLKDCKNGVYFEILQPFRLHVLCSCKPRALPWAKTLIDPSGLRNRKLAFCNCPYFSTLAQLGEAGDEGADGVGLGEEDVVGCAERGVIDFLDDACAKIAMDDVVTL